MRTPALVTALLAAAALSACGTTDPDPASSSASPSASPSASATPGATTTSPTPSPSGPDPSSRPTIPPPVDDQLPPGLEDDPRVQDAVADAEGRAGVVATPVVIAGYSKVTWNDGSLGCPTKGEVYTQALVPGELLLLRADQRLMSYHAADGGDFEYCATPSAGYSVRAG